MTVVANGVRSVVSDHRSEETVVRIDVKHPGMAADAMKAVAVKDEGMAVDAVIAMIVGVVPVMTIEEAQVDRDGEADAADHRRRRICCCK